MKSKARIAVGALAISAASFTAILNHEGFSKIAYPDPTWGWKVPTIGYGTTEGVKRGDTIAEPEARARALKDVEKFEINLKRCVKVPLHQEEYDVYVDLSYNIGVGAFCKSTLVKRLNAENYEGACKAILMWKRSNKQDCSIPGNKVCYGLWLRRLDSYVKCMSVQ